MRLFPRTRDLIGRVRLLVDQAVRFLGGLGLIALLLVAFVRDLAQFPRSITWPVTAGEVRESRYIQEDTFSIDFEYTYAVDGVEYEGSRITFFQYAVFANSYQNEQFIRAHPVGTRVDVYYDPRDPSQSVLMRTIPLRQLWSPVLFALCLLSILVSGVIGLLLQRFMRALRRRSEAYAEMITRE